MPGVFNGAQQCRECATERNNVNIYKYNYKFKYKYIPLYPPYGADGGAADPGGDCFPKSKNRRLKKPPSEKSKKSSLHLT